MTAPTSYRVYLAGSSAPLEIERVRRWSARLAAAGIEVTSTWPDTIARVGAANPRDASVDQRRQWSAHQLWEVSRADAIWLLCPHSDVTTRGAWVELGCAYTRALLIVSSGDTRQSIFTALGVEYETDEDAFSALLLVAARRVER